MQYVTLSEISHRRRHRVGVSRRCCIIGPFLLKKSVGLIMMSTTVHSSQGPITHLAYILQVIIHQDRLGNIIPRAMLGCRSDFRRVEGLLRIGLLV
jgi:hypothetical protein